VWEDASQRVLATLDGRIWQRAGNSGSITGNYERGLREERGTMLEEMSKR